MSLSPQSYEKCIGIARVRCCSCLVYIEHLTGESPSGCDGWTLRIKGGRVYNDWTGEVFPPYAPDPLDRSQYPKMLDKMDFRLAASMALAVEVERIRSEWRRQYKERVK